MKFVQEVIYYFLFLVARALIHTLHVYLPIIIYLYAGAPNGVIAMVDFRPYPIRITIILVILQHTIGHKHRPAINIGISVVIILYVFLHINGTMRISIVRPSDSHYYGQTDRLTDGPLPTDRRKKFSMENIWFSFTLISCISTPVTRTSAQGSVEWLLKFYTANGMKVR